MSDKAKIAKEEIIAATNPKLSKCPRCNSEEDEGHNRCFHCIKCCYLQCCDYGDYYER